MNMLGIANLEMQFFIYLSGKIFKAFKSRIPLYNEFSESLYIDQKDSLMDMKS